MLDLISSFCPYSPVPLKTLIDHLHICQDYLIPLLDYQGHLNVEVCKNYKVCTKLFMAFVLGLTATVTTTKINILLEVDSVPFFIG